jgi:hypothetical protein
VVSHERILQSSNSNWIFIFPNVDTNDSEEYPAFIIKIYLEQRMSIFARNVDINLQQSDQSQQPPLCFNYEECRLLGCYAVWLL